VCQAAENRHTGTTLAEGSYTFTATETVNSQTSDPSAAALVTIDLTDEATVAEAKRLCESKIAEWIRKKAERDPSGGVDASIRYRVLKAGRGRCELCGISSKLSPIDIDHIVPRNHADKHGFVVKDGVRMPLDDERNLQALCFRCNP
jgi:5-methylcytosine-specific restriction endonuclease McrA